LKYIFVLHLRSVVDRGSLPTKLRNTRKYIAPN
jgi:hypothetical protein